MTVSFSDSNYIVNEGRGQIQLEIEFSQETSQDFTIIASTMDGAATGNLGNHITELFLLVIFSSTRLFINKPTIVHFTILYFIQILN